MAMTSGMSLQEQNARRFMAIAATLGVVGVAFNLNGDGHEAPGVLLLQAHA
jgi:hypothetical protein